MKTELEYTLDGMRAHRAKLEIEVNKNIELYSEAAISLSELTARLEEINKADIELLLEINARTPYSDEIPF